MKSYEDILQAKIKQLEAQLREATKPTLIHKSWQALYVTGAGLLHTDRIEAVMETITFSGPKLALVRRDTYREANGDEKVDTTLEPFV